jgi:hypothetical protein
MKSAVFWNVTPLSLVEYADVYKKTYCLFQLPLPMETGAVE